MYATFGELPNKPSVNSSKEQFAPFSHFSRAFNVVKYPFDLRAAKIGIYAKSRGLDNVIGVSGFNKLIANIGSTSALPNDGIVDWLSCLFVPKNGCFSLVGNAYTCNLVR